MSEIERLMDFTWMSVQDRVAKIATEVFGGLCSASEKQKREEQAKK